MKVRNSNGMGDGNTMKKLCTLLIVLVLCMTLTAGAMADWSMARVETLPEYLYWLWGSNIMARYENDLVYLYRADGSPVTTKGYADASYGYGYLVVTEPDGGLNRCGVIDCSGNQVIPAEYGWINVLDSSWIVAVRAERGTKSAHDYENFMGTPERYLTMKSVDVFNMETGLCMRDIPRDRFEAAAAAENVLQIQDRASGIITAYDANLTALGTSDYLYITDFGQHEVETFRDNDGWKYGLRDSAGRTIMPAKYDLISFFYGNHAEVLLDGKSGLVDKAGSEVVAPRYEEILINYQAAYGEEGQGNNYDANGYFGIVENGRLGWVEEKTGLLRVTALGEDAVSYNGMSATYADAQGTLHIVSADGKDTAVGGYTNVTPLYHFSGLFYVVTDNAGKYGLIDWHGDEALPCVYENIEGSGDAKYILAGLDYENTELYEVEIDNAAAYVPYASLARSAASAQSVQPVQPSVTAVPKNIGERAQQASGSVQQAMGALFGQMKTTVSAATAEPTAAPTAVPQNIGEQAQQASGSVQQAMGTLFGKKGGFTQAAVTMPTAEPAPAPTAEPAPTEAPAAASSNPAVTTLLESAISLLDSGAQENKAAIVGLLGSAATLLGEGQASSMITSAVTLMEIDAAANAESIRTLIETVKTML